MIQFTKLTDWKIISEQQPKFVYLSHKAIVQLHKTCNIGLELYETFYDNFMVHLHLFWSFKIHCHCMEKSEYLKRLPFVLGIRVYKWWLLDSPTALHITCYLSCATVTGPYLTSAVLICIYVLWFANAAQLELTANFHRLEQIFIFLS